MGLCLHTVEDQAGVTGYPYVSTFREKGKAVCTGAVCSAISPGAEAVKQQLGLLTGSVLLLGANIDTGPSMGLNFTQLTALISLSMSAGAPPSQLCQST